MPKPRFRSGSLKKLHKRVIGGTAIRFERRKPSASRCALCKLPLKAVAREFTFKLRNISNSLKRPERKYGGYLCSDCTKYKFKLEARQLSFKKE